ncbi:hypothetical protein RN22_04290 [Grimontia sp. AD028]|nr:hypothetical protein RN22_04290 [Grimontia sp. AD028]
MGKQWVVLLIVQDLFFMKGNYLTSNFYDKCAERSGFKTIFRQKSHFRKSGFWQRYLSLPKRAEFYIFSLFGYES